MAIGSLLVTLEADIAQFTSSMDKASALAEQRMNQIDKSLGLVKTSLLALGAGAVAGLTLDAVKDKIEGVIKTAAGLQELAERTGGTVEKLSGLAAVAKLSGTDMDSLATGMQKLSKSMIDAQDGGKKSEEAFRAIGISVADLKGKKPDEVFQLIAQKMAGYADGAQKTAVAQQLLGKAGANLLPVLRDVADVGDLQVKVTAQQAAMALEFEHNLTRLSAASNAVWKAISMEALPVLNELTKVMLQSATGTGSLKEAVDKLAQDGTIKEWAQNAALAVTYVIEAFTGVAKAARAAIGSIQAVWADVKAGANIMSLGAGAFFSDEGRAKIAAELAARNKVVEDANKRYSDLWNYNGTAMSDALKKRFAIPEQPTAAPKRPDISYHPNTASGAKDDPAKAYMEGQIKAQDAIIAAEKKQLSAREQYLKEFYQQQYLSADEYYGTEVTLIQDSLKVELAAYDKEMQAAKDFLAVAQTKVKQQEALNKIQEIAAKQAQAVADASQRQTAVMLEAAKAHREFELATNAVVYQYGLENATAQSNIDMMGRGTLEVQKLTAARKIDLELQQRIHELSLKGYSDEDMAKEIATARAEAETQKATAIGLIEQAYRKQTDAAFGASEAFRKYAEEAQNVGAHIENTLTNALKGVEDAFVSLATTGKINFKSLADSIAADITRMAVKQSITGPLAEWLKGGMSSGTGLGGWLQSLLGGGGANAAQTAQETFRTTELIAQKAAETTATITATTAMTALTTAATSAATALTAIAASGGGGMGLLQSIWGGSSDYGALGEIGNMGADSIIPGFAGGGDLAAGQLSIVGEKGPELFRPSTAGTIIPNDKISIGGRGGDTHIYNITVPMPANASRQTAMQFGADVARQLSVAHARQGMPA